MLKLISVLSTIFFISGLSFSQTNYYVSITGNDSNTGLTEETAWRTITYSASEESPVSGGDHVHIKAGDYGNENVAMEKEATESLPIIFEGYQTIPEDNPNTNYSFGDELNSSTMPLLDGTDRTNSGEGFTFYSQQYVTLKNIQITNYQIAFDGWNASYCNLNNIIATNLGDYNSSYDGKGFSFSPNGDNEGGNDNTMTNCIVSNACAEGISIIGNNNTLENCRVYCSDDNTEHASMDYYIILAGDSNYVHNCYIERFGDIEHGGAGIGIKEYGQNNLFEYCTAKNLENACFYVRWAGVTNNEFRNCTALGTLEDVNGFTVRDGASYNEFNSCISDGCSSAIRFVVSGEDQNYCGENNTFNNCIIKDAVWAIEFNAWALPGIAENNTFANCIFDNVTYLFESARENNNNKLVNCIIKDVENLVTGEEILSVIYSYSDFHNTGFSIPAGTGNNSEDPLFVDAENGNYHLQEGSPCIDSGTSVDAPITDFEGTARPQGLEFDMGAYEFSTDISVLEINEIENIIYPNPTEGTVYFSMEYNAKKYQLVSSLGKLIKTGVILNNQIDISGLNNGVYYFKILDSNNVYKITKIILQGS